MSNQQSNRFFFNVDWITILVYVALCIVGFVNIYASIPSVDASLFNFSSNYGKQLIYIIAGLVLGLSILLFDAKFFSVFSPIVYGITVILLLVVLVVGRNVGGNQAWISIGGGFRLQPSEFAKFGTALLLARYIGNFNPKFRDFKSIAIAGLIMLIPLTLIMLQPDAGSALVFLSFMFPMYREGLSGYFLLIFLGMIVLFIADFLVPMQILIPIIVAVGGFFVYQNKRKQKLMFSAIIVTIVAIAYLFVVKIAYEKVLKPHQRTRIELILGLKMDPKGVGYN
ncbi:MAG: rod shape-determining protein RodA, partial [Pedobacter sp.]